ncbi:uncharacterized protein SAPINGB_P003461 [Magnusiomyces paraingens]|uniref:E3 ubiquitin ligase complex SCF subunit n=1 Tax=Magnusiomyces paraingens TaxID=2606893 RepID=A0A5E8BWY3_9ASCO|nr:uncharacterized protein SAPINGB_P003461 [Saprochaete ingens]VVT53215.1 unnamed protein product [Saprochaete ingens]
MVVLVSADDVKYTVDNKTASRSVLIKNMMEDLGDDTAEIPLPNATSNVLKKVIEYCEHHKDDPIPHADEDSEQTKNATDISEWDAKFFQVDQELLFEILLAANYLDIRSLLDAGSKTVANMIRNKTPEEIRKTFNIYNDFTPEEEQQIRRENEWAEDH